MTLMISTDVPAPNGIRLRRACAAFATLSHEVWGNERAAKLTTRPPWVQEIWARVADAVIEVLGSQVDVEGRGEALKRKRALAAAATRDALEGRDAEGLGFDGSPEATCVWMAVVDAVMGAENVPWEHMA